jgi:hypothetical protein
MNKNTKTTRIAKIVKIVRKGDTIRKDRVEGQKLCRFFGAK